MSAEAARSISIIIPTYNRCDDLRQCLQSIDRQRGGAVGEVIVVDDCGTDQSAAMVQQEFPQVKYQRCRRNYGPAHARNIGIMHATGEYLLFLDSDTEFRGVDAASRFLEFLSHHPETGCVGGEVTVGREISGRVWGRNISWDGNSTPVGLPDRKNIYIECDFLPTCCCMVRRNVAGLIGGFDPFYGFGGEDKDFGYRIKQLGYPNYLSADVAVLHHHSPRGRSLEETYKYHLTRMRFALKNYTRGRAYGAALGWLLRAVGFYLMVPVKLPLLWVRRRRIVKENWLGGYCLLKALVYNIRTYSQIVACREKHFIDEGEMCAYEAWCEDSTHT